MRRLTPKGRTKPIGRLGISVWLMATGMGWAQSVPDAYLNVQPRTAAEIERIASVLAPPLGFDSPEPFESLPGGASTTMAPQPYGAFAQPSGAMTSVQELDFIAGSGLFDKLWVQAPSSTLASDGLGPLYNARSCEGCHQNNGRGVPQLSGTNPALVLRLSAASVWGEGQKITDGIPTAPDPTYGAQLQPLGASAVQGEGRLVISYTETKVNLGGGETVSLRAPEYTVTELGYSALAPSVMTSPRIAQQLVGLGLLDAVPAADVLALADPNDANGDGISGRANMVWSHEFGQPTIGRFGHKATMPSLRAQVAQAFAADIGISSPLHPSPSGDCTQMQLDCLAAPMGDGDQRGTEIDAIGLDLTTLYVRNLAVPGRQNIDAPDILAGKQLFYQIGCPACHQPKFVTHRLPEHPAQSFQLIWPYTDMLVHDMGPGLADNRPDGMASGTEWRTAPLWGIGRTTQVSGVATYLHDGRARSLLEAILWHGGEAQTQTDTVAGLTKANRAALIAYLESL